MPDNAKHIKLMRITIREDFSLSMTDMVGARRDSCRNSRLHPMAAAGAVRFGPAAIPRA